MANKQTKFLSALLLFIASAAMLTVIQPPISISALAWIVYVPFILACSPDSKKRQVFFAALLTGTLYWLGNLYWIAPITIIGWITLCIYTGLLWPILALCIRFCRARKIPLFIAAAVLVVGTERMQGLFLGGFYWRFLAHSQYNNITVIQIADIFGAGGVSFLIAMVNGLSAELLLTAREKKLLSPASILKTAAVIAMLAGSLIYGRWRITQESDFIEPGPRIASLQSNIPQSVKNTFESSEEIFAELIDLSKSASEAGAELIVWPETMVQVLLNDDVLPYLQNGNEYDIYNKTLKDHAKNNAYLLIGGYGGKVEKDKQGELYLARFNSAFLYTPQGSQSSQIYNKIHLVPFGEVLPFRKRLPAAYELLMKFTPYDYDYSLDYGSEYTVFEMPLAEQNRNYKFSVLICYEDTVPVLSRKFALDSNGQKRLNWLINISNDGWFVRFKDDHQQVYPSTELIQHAAVCTFRAVENRLAIIRSVNTGISCLIDSSGRIRDGYISGTLPEKARQRTGMSGWFIDTIPLDSRTTFFSKYGQWLDFSCQGCVFILIIAALLRKLTLFKQNKLLNGTKK